jgi:hypothetical protein
MGHKILKDHAYVFCQMFMGWRMAADLETFSKLPDGQLHIDVLAANCFHSERGPVDTNIVGEIRSWFFNRLEQHKIPASDVTSATLTVKMKNTIASKHKMGITFDWTCDGRITTVDRKYSAHLDEPHTWLPAFSKQNAT